MNKFFFDSIQVTLRVLMLITYRCVWLDQRQYSRSTLCRTEGIFIYSVYVLKMTRSWIFFQTERFSINLLNQTLWKYVPGEKWSTKELWHQEIISLADYFYHYHTGNPKKSISIAKTIPDYFSDFSWMDTLVWKKRS